MIGAVGCLVALTGAVAPARAEDPGNHLYDRFQVSASGAVLWFATEARIDGEDGDFGTEVDLEDKLGFSPTKFQPRADFRWRPGRRHELQAGYQFARRTSDKTLSETIEVGDTSFTAGANIRGTFDSDNVFFTYRYSILADERKQAGVGLGLGAFFFDFGVDALAGVAGGGQQATVEYSDGASFVGPTGALGLFARFRSGERWYLSPDVRYLYVKVDRVEARVIEAGFGAQYYVSDKLGIEGGYGLRALQIDIGPRTDGGGLVDIDASARVKYAEHHARVGLVYTL